MRTRIDEIPACFVETISVSYERYNLIQLALRRLGSALRFPLIGLRHLDMILESDRWVCVDRVTLDLPVAAWHRFEKDDQLNLQTSVSCELRHYQVNTDILLPYIWMTMESILRERLSKEDYQKAAVVRLFDN